LTHESGREQNPGRRHDRGRYSSNGNPSAWACRASPRPTCRHGRRSRVDVTAPPA